MPSSRRGSIRPVAYLSWLTRRYPAVHLKSWFFYDKRPKYTGLPLEPSFGQSAYVDKEFRAALSTESGTPLPRARALGWPGGRRSRLHTRSDWRTEARDSLPQARRGSPPRWYRSRVPRGGTFSNSRSWSSAPWPTSGGKAGLRSPSPRRMVMCGTGELDPRVGDRHCGLEVIRLDDGW